MAIILSLRGKTAIVTGGANGIGRATAEQLAQAEATVIIFDIDDEAGQMVAAQGTNIHFIHCDMGNKQDIDRAYHEAIDSNKKIDILINNVGIEVLDGHIMEMSEQGIANMEQVNVQGPFHLTRRIMNHMQKHGGCITFVASTQALIVEGAPSVYNIQKNTILGMVKAFAVAGGPFGIRVNAVSPGAIATEGMGSAESAGEERIRAINHNTPLGRRGRPEEVAHEIINLCFAKYTTGDNRLVDGGFSKVALPVELRPSKRSVLNDPDAAFFNHISRE
ncbi:MAG: SDR family oxidoreductase [Candidatus Saccharibacteria bacterium]|nr:MAG: SDR family oxidoreductase [Candidatus Saccharibacteria bacterium]